MLEQPDRALSHVTSLKLLRTFHSVQSTAQQKREGMKLTIQYEYARHRFA